MTHGGQHENTFAKTAEHCTGRLDEQGCWSVKMRRNVGVKVGCYLTEASARNRATKHFAMCAHGAIQDGGSSRKSCLKVAKQSQDWCKSCKKAHKALTEAQQADEAQ